MPAPSASPPTSSSSSSTSTPCCLLVTGASGNLGQRVLAHLLDTLRVAPCRLVAGSRSPEQLEAFALRGVLTRWLDFRDAASVRAAAQCVDRVLLISVPEDDEDRVALHENAVRALRTAGVKHIVYTSFLNADHATALGARDHRETERCIRASGVRSFTFLRNSVYFDNLAVWIAGVGGRSGEWSTAAQRGRLGGISRDDAALAAAVALARDDNGQEIYELASAHGLTIDEIVAAVAKAVGVPIRAVHVSEDALAKEVVARTSVAPLVARAFASLDAHVAAGLAEPRGDDFQRLTGRAPTTHTQWLEANRALLLRVA